MVQFQMVFDHIGQGQTSHKQLLRLCQGAGTVFDYALDFRVLAVDSGWNEAAFIDHFREGLHPDLQTELVCHDVGLRLAGIIQLAITLDTHLRDNHRRSPHHVSLTKSSLKPPASAREEPAPDPMQLGATHLSAPKTQRRCDTGGRIVQ